MKKAQEIDDHYPEESGPLYIRQSLHLLGITFITAVIAEHTYSLSVPSAGPWVGKVAAMAIIGLSFMMYRNGLYQKLSAQIFPILNITVIGLASLLGITLFSLHPDLDHSGTILQSIFQAVHLDDIFHSWWYLAFLLLLGVSLLLKIFQRTFKTANINYYLALLGALVVIIGLCLFILWGWRGSLSFDTGTTHNQIDVFDGNTTDIKGQISLPFMIAIDNFAAIPSKEDYRIRLSQNALVSNPHAGLPNGPEMTTQAPDEADYFPLIHDKIRQVGDTSLYFRLNAFYPDFGFTYGYPSITDTIQPRDAGIMGALIIGKRRLQLQLRSRENHILTEPHMGADLEFYWTAPANLSGMPVISLPDSGIRRIIFVGSDETMLFISDAGKTITRLERNKEYIIPGTRGYAYYHQFIFPDAQYITASPGTLSNQMNNPVAKVEVWGKAWPRAEFAYLYPPRRGPAGLYNYPGTQYHLGLSLDSAHQTYRADISVNDPNGTALKNGAIRGDQALYYGGYRIGKIGPSDDPDHTAALEVTRLTGLPWIITGFACMLLSLIISVFAYFLKRKGTS